MDADTKNIARAYKKKNYLVFKHTIDYEDQFGDKYVKKVELFNDDDAIKKYGLELVPQSKKSTNIPNAFPYYEGHFADEFYYIALELPAVLPHIYHLALYSVTRSVLTTTNERLEQSMKWMHENMVYKGKLENKTDNVTVKGIETYDQSDPDNKGSWMLIYYLIIHPTSKGRSTETLGNLI